MAVSIQNHDTMFKILVVGDISVGKTCILNRYAEDSYYEQTRATVEIDIKPISVELNGKKIRLQIWDTMGQERFNAIPHSYYRGAKGIMLVYDITRTETFQSLSKWILRIDEHADEDTELMLIGNKCDMEDNREVSRYKGEHMSKKYGIPFFETSAKSNDNIDEAFLQLVQVMYDKYLQSSAQQVDADMITLTDQPRPKKKCWC